MQEDSLGLSFQSQRPHTYPQTDQKAQVVVPTLRDTALPYPLSLMGMSRPIKVLAAPKHPMRTHSLHCSIKQHGHQHSNFYIKYLCVAMVKIPCMNHIKEEKANGSRWMEYQGMGGMA